MEKKWYVLQTYVNRENQIKLALEKLLTESDLAEYFGDIHISSHKTFIVRNGKRIVKEKKIFPSYIMIEMVMTPETKRLVMSIPKAMKFMGSGQTPIPISDKEKNRILGIKQDDGETISEINFIVGSRMKIIEGPFKDFEGSIGKINSDKQKLVVNVTVFGRITPVEVNYNQVELLD
ncbi:MAG: transcription termination/antitermination protein NusG [Candidatus Cloacimonadota bacterium]|nr:transcription termination/antitermination protein NusG [Candidatus Cloacimonadota bacterium]